MTSNKITISLTRYNEPNWLVWQALQSLACQQHVQAEVLFLDQSQDREIEKKLEKLNTKNVCFKHINIKAESLSFARNYAIKAALSNYILFIDCDAIADKNWAFHLSECLTNRAGAIVGGKILPKWHSTPLAITKAGIVREQYSLLDLGNHEIEARKIVGAGFGINRKLLDDEAYFNANLGRRRGLLLGGEETDLCERALERGLRVYYNGNSVVHHQILAERICYKWIFRRIYYSGVGRGLRKGPPKPTHKTGLWDYIVLPIILPWYAAGYLHGRLAGSI